MSVTTVTIEDDPVRYKWQALTEILTTLTFIVGYLAAILAIFQYFLSVLHAVDGLQTIESFYRNKYSGQSTPGHGHLDWGWMGFIGWMTVLSQLYMLIITLRTLSKKNEALTREVHWETQEIANYILVVDAIFAVSYGLVCFMFYMICTVYNYKLVTKYLHLSSPEGLAYLNSERALSVDPFIDWAFLHVSNVTGNVFFSGC